MGQPLPNKAPIGIVTSGNLLHCNDDGMTSLIQRICTTIPVAVDFIDINKFGMKLLDFLENKERIIIIDPADSNELSAAEILYWSHHIGNIPKQIITIHADTEQIIVSELIKYLHEWGVYPVDGNKFH